MNSPAPSEHIFHDPIFSEVEDEDNGLYYDEEGNVLDLSHVDWSQHAFVAANNDSCVSAGDDLLVPSAGRIVALVFFMVIFVVGVVGNGLVVYTVGRQVSTRKVTYLYLLNLSASNLLYLVICLPTLSVSYTIISWPFGNVLCKLNNYVMSVSMAVSVLTITATGFDRYLAVIYPVESRMLRTTRRAVVINGSCWLVSLLIMIPRIFLYNEKKVFHVVSLVTLCYRAENLFNLQIDTVLNFVLMYLLPLTLLSLFHFRIGKRLWYITRPGTRTVQTGNTQVLVVKDRRRIAKIVFAITLVFALGWLPIHVYHLAEDFHSGLILFGQEIDRGTLVLFFSFGANSFNPILYCMFSGRFRQSFRKALRLCAMKLSRTVHVEEAANVRMERVPQLEYRRPPPVLLPRPPTISDVEAISFLRPLDKICTNTKLTKPLIQGMSSEFCVNSLEAVKEIMPDSSPLSLKKEPHINLMNDEEATPSVSPITVLLDSKTVGGITKNSGSRLCGMTDSSNNCHSSQVTNRNDGQLEDHDSDLINPQCSSHIERLTYTNLHANLDSISPASGCGRAAQAQKYHPRNGGVVSETDLISTCTSSTINGGGLSTHCSTTLIVPSRSVTKHFSELMTSAANFGNLLTPLNNQQTKHLPRVE